MGGCLGKPRQASQEATSDFGRATIAPRTSDTLVTFLEQDFACHNSVVVLNVQADLPKLSPARKLAITLCALETDAAAVDVISPALAHENPGSKEWWLIHIFEQTQCFRLKFHLLDLFGDTPTDTAAANGPPAEELGQLDFVLAELLCQQGQTLSLELQPHGVACTLAAQPVIAPGTALNLDVSLTSRHPSLEALVLHLARQQGASWAPILTAQAAAGAQAWHLHVPVLQLWGPPGSQAVQWSLHAGSTPLGSCRVALPTLLHADQRHCNLALTDSLPADEADPALPQLQVRRSELISQPCFLDYIVGGCHLSLIVAVDLSESNLPQSDKASMHYQRQKGAASACQQAFCTLAEVALAYCGVPAVTLWGFGGSLSDAACYPLNGNSFMPRVEGIAGMVQAYQSVLAKSEMLASLQLAPVLRAAMQEVMLAAPDMNTVPETYHVLIIIISQDPQDLQEVQEVAADLACLPMSVLITGIGAGTFKPLQALLEAQPGPAELHALRFCRYTPGQGSCRELASQLLQPLPQRVEAIFSARSRATDNGLS